MNNFINACHEFEDRSIMNEDLTTAIQNIVTAIPEGCVFDSHLIIEMLRTENLVVYAEFVDQFEETDLCSAHGLIAQQIHNANCERVVIAGVERQSYSINVHNNPSLCASWIRR